MSDDMTPLLIDLERLSARLRDVSAQASGMVYALWLEYSEGEGE